MVAPIYWCRNTNLSFLCTILYLSISISSAISVPPSPHLPPPLHLPPLLHLPRHLHLIISIFLHIASKRKLIKKEIRSEQFPVSCQWGLLMYLHLAETEIHWIIKNNALITDYIKSPTCFLKNYINCVLQNQTLPIILYNVSKCNQGRTSCVKNGITRKNIVCLKGITFLV